MKRGLNLVLGLLATISELFEIWCGDNPTVRVGPTCEVFVSKNFANGESTKLWDYS
jgi:hypothetical protein